MEYQKIIFFLDNTPNQPSKFRTKTWVEINDNTCGMHNSSQISQIKFKTSMLKSMSCNYSDAYILVSGTITVPNTEQQQPQIIKKIDNYQLGSIC